MRPRHSPTSPRPREDGTAGSLEGRRAPLPLRLLLRLYPRRFRDAFAREMEATFLDRVVACRARGRGLAALWLRTTADVTRTALAERRRSSLDPHTPREPRQGEHMAGFLSDLRFSARLLAKQRAYTLFVVLTLGVGIGANTAVFSTFKGVLLAPLPYPESDRLVAVWSRFLPESGFNFEQFALSAPEYFDYRAATRVLDGVAAYSSGSATVSTPGATPERIQAVAVTPDLFDVLRVRPALGRAFTAEEGRPNGQPVALLTHGYWQRRFGGARDIVGQTIAFNGRSAEVVGILPQGVAFPDDDIDVWVPLALDPANPGGRSAHGLLAVGRLAPGGSVEAAMAELAPLMASWKQEWPKVYTGHFLFVRSLLEDRVGPVRPILTLLFAATGFLLLIVCANVGGIVLARGATRARELAVRSALGASRPRLVRIVLAESLLLAAAGGLAGVGLAWAGLRLLRVLDAGSLPRAHEVALDPTVLAFAAGTALLSAFVFGVVPAWRTSRVRVQDTLRSDGRTASASRGHRRFHRALVGFEVALGVVLVVGAGLVARSLVRLTAVDPGFDSRGVLLATISLPSASYKEPGQVAAFYDTLLARIRALPGVTAASAASGVPLYRDNGVWDFDIEGAPEPGPGQPAWNGAVLFPRPGFFEALQVPIVRGRTITDQDTASSQPVVLINEALARQFFDGAGPIGRRIRVSGGTPPNPWMTIAGIVGNVRDRSLHEPPRPMYFMPAAQAPVSTGGPARTMALVMRGGSDPSSLAPALRSLVMTLDPALAVFRIAPYAEIVGDSVARQRFTASLLGIFALVGLLLGASGIYGVLAYSVSQRTQEIGIRRALGAPAGAVTRSIVAQALAPVAGGLAAGVGGAFWLSRALGSYLGDLLYQVSPTDAGTYLVVVLAVLAIACVAALLPVRRALAVGPLTALRTI